jgi:hypothetical protein
MRPIRPKPLIPTFVGAIFAFLLKISPAMTTGTKQELWMERRSPKKDELKAAGVLTCLDDCLCLLFRGG